MESHSSDSSQSPSETSSVIPNPFYKIDKARQERRLRDSQKIGDTTMPNWDESHVESLASGKSATSAAQRNISHKQRGSSPSGSDLEMIEIGSQPDRRGRTENQRSGSALLNPTQTSEVVDLTGPSPPASPALEIENGPEYTESPRLPNGPGWVQKSKPAGRQQPRPSMRRVQTLKEVSISPRKRGVHCGSACARRDIRVGLDLFLLILARAVHDP